MPNSPWLIAAFTALTLLLNACSDTRTAEPAVAPPASTAPLPIPARSSATHQDTPVQTAAPQAAASASASVAATPASVTGKRIYGKYCALCHADGVAGAPKPGDKAQWSERTARGQNLLYQRAIEGFKGVRGSMPARGGASHLTDDEVRAAVDYMASPSRP